MKSFSTSPEGEKFELPDKKGTEQEIAIIKKLCHEQRKKNREIIVVQGLGFVGAVIAAVSADCEVKKKIPYFVFGVDLPSEDSYWKIPIINRGISPFKVEDPEVELIFRRVVKEKDNLRATWVKEVYAEADIVVIDINLDVIKLELGNSEKFKVKLEPFKNAIKDVGNYIKPDSLLLVETTIPPGTIQNIINPMIKECFKKRGINPLVNPPLIAHCYERVMPGRDYVNSIRKMWRTFSAVNEKASQKVKDFLSKIVDTKHYPLIELHNTQASELGKILENTYRAMNIAFIYEWTLFAEDIGINLFDVIDSIRVRKGTHDNMMYPGFGVGGYCLPKDTLLAEWASKNLFKRNEKLKFSLEAINVNDLMPLHTFDLLKKGLNGNVKNEKIAILGASYRKDIDDTRNTPTILLHDEIKKAGGVPVIHDPYVKKIDGREDIKVKDDIKDTLKNAKVAIFTINHELYVNLVMTVIVENLSNDALIIDAFNVLNDDKIKILKKSGFNVLGVGKGHIKGL